MREVVMPIFLGLGLSACGTPPPQEQMLNLVYQPGTAVKDSVLSAEGSRATFCVLLDVDGKEVENSIRASIEASRGRGNVLYVRRIERLLDPGLHKVTIGCRATSAAPIFDALNGFAARGTVEFMPLKGHTYLIAGKVSSETSSVWIEDEGTSGP